MILVTGGAGFIGSNFVLDWLSQSDEAIINIDKLTYAGNLENLKSLKDNPLHIFVKGDIGDANLISELLNNYSVRAILNFAAESHVDRSIHGPADFIQTNVIGTFNLLECARKYWGLLGEKDKKSFRFLQVWPPKSLPSLRVTPTSQIAPTQQPRRPAIIWCELGCIPTGCPF